MRKLDLGTERNQAALFVHHLGQSHGCVYTRLTYTSVGNPSVNTQSEKNSHIVYMFCAPFSRNSFYFGDYRPGLQFTHVSEK